MLAMAAELHAAGRAFTLHYCARSRAQAAFVPQLERAPYAAQVQLHFSNEQRLDLAAVLTDVPANTHVYVCGPTRLMDAVAEQAQTRGTRRAKSIRNVLAPRCKPAARPLMWWRLPAGSP